MSIYNKKIFNWVTCRLFLQGIYKKNDMDNSGTMSTPEMRMALKEAGESLGIF